MSISISVRDLEGDARYGAGDLPLAVGGDEGARVRLPGAGAGPVAFLGHGGERYYLQPGPDRQAGSLDGRPLTESVWLEGGEILVARGCAIRLELEGEGLAVRVDPDPADRITAPPVLESAPAAAVSREGPAGEAGDEEAIRPAAYQAARRGAVARRRRFPVVAVVTWTGLAVLAAAAWFMFAARSVELIVSPEPETVEVAGGLSVRFGPRYLMHPGEYRVQATLPGYEPLSATVEVTEARAQSIQLTMERLGDRLFVEVPGVEDAQVVVDGEPAGQAPLEAFPLRPGRHRLLVRADGYVPEERDLDVEGGGNTLRLVVELVPDFASVTVTSRPAGAEVVSDGEALGVTPLEAVLPSGSHELELRKAGYKTHRQRIVVEPDVPLVVPEVALAPSDGRLALRSEPEGATVLVNGEFRGRTPLTVDLDPGRGYRIEISEAGYETATRSVELRSGETRTERVSLTPVTGVIELEVSPAGVSLAVDGRDVGAPPERLELLAVPHRLAFTKPGHVPQAINVKPTPGVPQRLQVRLMSEEEAALAAIPARIRNGQGAELVLVRPGRFTLGAERDAPGRRANESLREVAITRPFYVGVREVTNREFRDFRNAHRSGTAIGYGLDADPHPVARVTWQDAAAYCNWLSQKDGLPAAYREESGRLVPVLPFNTGYRLPTEAEWAWAVRYAGREVEPPRYPWGNTLPPPEGAGNYGDYSARAGLREVLASYDDGFPVSAPVGSFKPNALGLYDGGGNVSEWTNDLYRIYPGNEPLVEDPTGPEEGRYYVIRGSSWRHGSIVELRQTWRDFADEGRPDLGFRIVRRLE